MKETVQSRQETAIKEISLMVETLFSQGIISETVFSGITKRLAKIEKDPYSLFYDIIGQRTEVEMQSVKYELTIQMTKI